MPQEHLVRESMCVRMFACLSICISVAIPPGYRGGERDGGDHTRGPVRQEVPSSQQGSQQVHDCVCVCDPKF